MKNTIFKYCPALAVGLFTCFIAQIASAQLQGFGKGEGVVLGLGVVAENSPYKEAEDSTVLSPIPYIAYEWENAHLGVDGFSYDFLESNHFQMSLLLDPRWSFISPDDSPLFEGIERETALEAGMAAYLRFGSFYLATEFLVDVSDTHNGYEGDLKLGFELEISDLSIDLSIGATRKSDDLNQYLYGVDKDEAKPTLPEYKVEETTHPVIAAEFALPVTDNLAVIGFGRYESFSDEVKNSPLIDEKGEASVGLAILRRF